MNPTNERISALQLMQKIERAAQILEGHAHNTPVLSSRTLNKLCGRRVFLKCENFQRVGAFKFRGAFNAISRLSDEQRANGVLTYSSGNHAQAMALAGRLLGIAVTVVMPNNAPPAKLAATKEYGANVVFYDAATEVREEVAARLPQAQKATLIPPFDHYDVIAGQGTAALELFDWYDKHQTSKNAGTTLAAVYVPVGGAGLLAGTAVASHFRSPTTRTIGVEPEHADDAFQSMSQGRRIRRDDIDTIADGTRTPCVGHRNFAVMQEHVAEIVTVSEAAIEQAVWFLYERMKIVVEPSGALGVAALMANPSSQRDDVGVVVSGGNVDHDVFQAIIAKYSAKSTLSQS